MKDVRIKICDEDSKNLERVVSSLIGSNNRKDVDSTIKDFLRRVIFNASKSTEAFEDFYFYGSL